jgi:biopolymer transport protein ExbB
MHAFFIIALIVTSIVAVAFMIERGLALRRIKAIPPEIEWVVSNYAGPADLPKLINTCEQNPSSLSRLLLFTTEHLDWERNEVVTLLETRARHEVTQLERGLVVLEIVVGIAPLQGLVGTIYGLIMLFASNPDVAAAGNTNQFAQGISLALNATLLGLLIAIPTLVGWSIYTKRVETLSIEMESLCDEFLRKHYRPNEAVTPMRRPAVASRG